LDSYYIDYKTAGSQHFSALEKSFKITDQEFDNAWTREKLAYYVVVFVVKMASNYNMN
jgi:hypothetical protein